MGESRVITLAAVLVLTLVLLVGCAPGAAPAPERQSPAPAATAKAPSPASVAKPAAPAKPAWEEEWEKLVEAARLEGRVVITTSLGAEQRQIIVSAFKSRYGVSVESVTGGSSDLAPKLRAEQRASIYSSDVTMGGSGTYVSFEGLIDSLDPVLILPELTEPELIKKTWYFGEVPWADKAHTMLIALMDLQLPVTVNTTLVKTGEIKTYRDLLDPKWKEKISLQDPRVGGMGRMWFAAVLELGDVDINFIRELVTKQDLFVTRDRKLQVEWLARGKHAITLGPNGPTVEQFIDIGAPLARFNPGSPFMSGGAASGIAVWKRAPHPNATKLFINWLLSREGQGVHNQATRIQSQRLDASTAGVQPGKLITPGLKVFNASNEEFDQKRETTVYPKLAKDVFGP